MNKDLTTGKPEKVLWQFCLPLFGSIIFQQLYNIADSFVAGKFISDNALAAVGNSYEITLIFIAFAFGCNIACSVLAALFFGAKQYNDLKTTVYTALISSCVICAVLMLVGTLCCDSLLRLIKTPEEVFEDSKLYLDIYIYGLPFVFLYNVATGIFSALGDSKTPFIFLACSSTSNIAVDILFVTAFNMGVAGVAWATFLCQGISCVLALLRSRCVGQTPFAAVRGVSEGLEHRLERAVRASTTHEELLDALTTVRYPRARMRRLAMDAALGYDDALPALPPYLHLLGARREALSLLKDVNLPVSHALMRLKDENDACARMVSAQLTASDFSALCRKTPEPMGSALRQKIIFLTK
mgnify:CR=1 FL=1